MKKIILYDDFHSIIPKEQDVIGTIRPTFSRTALRNGYKIIEIEDDELQQTESIKGGNPLLGL